MRDFPVWDRPCYLEFAPTRVACPRCGVVVEALDRIGPHQRQTLRYEKYVIHLCDLLPVLDVAELEGLDKGTVYRLDRQWLERPEAFLADIRKNTVELVESVKAATSLGDLLKQALDKKK